MLPPVQFTSTPTEFIVSWDEDDWREVFSALMAGADLLYPEKAHEVVWHLLKQVEYPVPNIGFGFDSEVNLWGHEAVVAQGNPLTVTASGTQIHNVFVAQSPAALNNKLRWTRFLAAGDWAYSYQYRRVVTNGVIDIYATPASGGTVVVANDIDLRGATLDNQFLRGTFALTKSEEYTIEVEVVATTLAPNYNNTFTLLQMWRVG